MTTARAPLTDDPPDMVRVIQPLTLGTHKEFVLDARGVRCTEDLAEFDSWDSVAVFLTSQAHASPAQIGDCLLYGEDRYGDRFVQACASLPVKPATIAQYMWVYQRVPYEIRQDAPIGYAHHRIVASRPVEEQKYWLEQAVEQQWSSKDLGRSIAAAERIEQTVYRVTVACESEDDQARVLTVLAKAKIIGVPKTRIKLVSAKVLARAAAKQAAADQPKRPRGRPRKVRPVEEEALAFPKRPRGRPRKPRPEGVQDERVAQDAV